MSISKKHSEYIDTILKSYGPVYINKIRFEDKWSDFKNQDTENCIISWPDLESKGYHREYYNKKKRQLLKQAKILILKDEFTKEILRVSEKWKLNEKVFGLNLEDEKKPAKPLYDIEYFDTLLTLWKCYLSSTDVFNITEKNGYDKIRKLVGNRYNLLDVSVGAQPRRFCWDIEKILDTYNLSLIWEDSVSLLLLTGYFILPLNLCPVVVRKYRDKLELSIPIFKDTGLEDIRVGWLKLKELKRELYGKFRNKPTDDLDQYIRVYKGMQGKDTQWHLIDEKAMAKDDDDLSVYKASERIKKGRKTLSENIRNIDQKTVRQLRYIKSLENRIDYKADLFIL